MATSDNGIGSFGLAAKVEVWRAQVAAGTMTKEAYREVIETLRQARGTTKPVAGGSATTKKAASKKAPAKSADDLLAGLDDLP